MRECFDCFDLDHNGNVDWWAPATRPPTVDVVRVCSDSNSIRDIAARGAISLPSLQCSDFSGSAPLPNPVYIPVLQVGVHGHHGCDARILTVL